MLYIFPIEELMLGLREGHNSYCYASGMKNNNPTDAQLYGVLVAILNETLNSRLAWPAPTNEVTTALASFVDEYSEDENDQASSSYFNNVIIDLPDYCQMKEFICTLVPANSWDVWLLRRVGGVVYLEKGQDFRILEFERLVEAGAIDVTDKVKKLLKK